MPTADGGAEVVYAQSLRQSQRRYRPPVRDHERILDARVLSLRLAQKYLVHSVIREAASQRIQYGTSQAQWVVIGYDSQNRGVGTLDYCPLRRGDGCRCSCAQVHR